MQVKTELMLFNGVSIPTIEVDAVLRSLSDLYCRHYQDCKV